MKLPIRSLLIAAGLMLVAYGSRAQTSPADLPVMMAPPLTPENTAPSGQADPTGPTAPHATEQELLQSGAYAAQYGIQLSRLALTKTLSAGLKDFATRVIADHTRSLTYLKPAAAKARVTLPVGLDATHKAALAALAKLNGKAFETKYVAQIKKASQLAANTLAAYREVKPTQPYAVETWIGMTLPIMQNHLGMVQEVEQGKIKL